MKMDESETRDKLISAMKGVGIDKVPEPSPGILNTRVLHKADNLVGVLETETDEINKTEVSTLLREGSTYQVVTFSKKVWNEIKTDEMGKLRCSCLHRKPCNHLMAVDVAIQNKVFIPSLLDVLCKMEDIE